MKIVKIRLRKKMEDEFLANSLITYIEKDTAKLFDDALKPGGPVDNPLTRGIPVDFG